MTGIVLAETAADVVTDTTAADPTAEPANELLELFTRYNRAVWPGHLLAYVIAVGVIGLVRRRPGRTTDRITAGALAALWLWLGVVYLGRYAAQIDATLAALYAAMFVVQAGMLLRAGVARDRLRFAGGHGVAGWVGWIAIGYALVGLPADRHRAGSRVAAGPAVRHGAVPIGDRHVRPAAPGGAAAAEAPAGDPGDLGGAGAARRGRPRRVRGHRPGRRRSGRRRDRAPARPRPPDAGGPTDTGRWPGDDAESGMPVAADDLPSPTPVRSA